MSEKNVLVIAPHLDDEVLGCGGVIAKHGSGNDSVYVCFIAHRVYNHVYDEEKMKVEKEHSEKARQILGYKDTAFLDLPDERLDACIQDIIIPLEKFVDKIKPEVVYSPFYNDNNQDHQAVAKAVQVVLRPLAVPYVKRWLVYETPSSTEQAPPVGNPGFKPNVYSDIKDFIKTKLNAMACYETEARSYPHPRSPQGIKALAMKRGIEADLHFAESFMLAREKN